MTTFINFRKTNVVGIHIDGNISDAEFDEVTIHLDEKLKRYGGVRFYAEIENFDGAGLKGFFRELKFRMKNLSKFEKDVVVTDKKWMQICTSIADELFPSMEVRSFPHDHTDQARAWITD